MFLHRGSFEPLTGQVISEVWKTLFDIIIEYDILIVGGK